MVSVISDSYGPGVMMDSGGAATIPTHRPGTHPDVPAGSPGGQRI